MQNNNWQHLSITQLSEHLQNSHSSWQLADIRDPNSFAGGHIDSAVNINNENLQQFIEEADLDAPLVVICYHGHSSQGAAAVLCSAGFEDVYSLDGGMTAWAEAYPKQVETSST